MKLKFILICFGLLFTQLVLGQEKEIKGTVSDEDGMPLASVNVIIEGAESGTITDFEGNYSIVVAEKSFLVFSSMGFQEQRILVENQDIIDVVMKVADNVFDEVIVIGYGTQRKGDNTAAISSVKGESLEKMASTNPVNALQGKVPGLSITNTGGNPGQQADITLRGVGTFGNHQPLFIIDGFQGDPQFLNANDIESIEVLKDGAAAAIYGSRAANGVILITTKKGKKGEPVITANSYFSWVSPTKKYKLLDADGYKNVHRMMYENAGIPQSDWPAYITLPSDINTNWQDAVNRQGTSQFYNVAIRGGAENVNYSLSGNFNKDEGTLIGSNFGKQSISAKTGIDKGILNVDFNASYTETRNEDYKFSLRETYFQSPLLPIYDENEEYGFALMKDGLPPVGNPVGDDYYINAYNKTKYFMGNASLKLNLFEGFNYTAKFGIQSSHEFADENHPPYWTRFNDPPNLYSYVYNQHLSWQEGIMEHILNYDKSFNNHNLSLMAGTTATSQKSNWLSADVEGKSIVRSIVDGQIVEVEVPAGFLNPDFSTIDGGNGGTYSAGGSRYVYNRSSLFGRVNYDYDGKYLAQISVRRDGSSKFGQDNRYGVFPSAAVGWKISQEPFLEDVYWINHLKLRGSYGKLGNESALGYYEHQTLISIINDWTGGYVTGGTTPWQGGIAKDLDNRELKWETTTSYNAGVDFGFLKNQLTGSINYYVNRTSDLLIRKELPPSMGLNNPILNVGEIENKGVEFEVNFREKRNDFDYSITGTFSTGNNKVLKLADEGQILYGEGLKFGSDHIATQTRVGKEIGAFYLYQADGVFKSQEEIDEWNAMYNNIQPNARPGDVRFLDVNGDGVLDEKDKIYSGSGFPSVFYGLNFDASYKQFDISLFFQGVAGNKIYNGNAFELEGMDAGRNFLASAANAWTPDNPNSNVPRAVLGDPNGNNRASTRFLENGDYLRLKTIQLGYTLPKELSRKFEVERFRIYASTQNLLTFTKYSGLDPEVGRTSVLDTGVDRILYPLNKRVLVGLQVTL